MDLFITGFVAGVIGTLAMDLLNNLVARTGVFLKIDVTMIGRMVAGWTRGRFSYRHPVLWSGCCNWGYTGLKVGQNMMHRFDCALPNNMLDITTRGQRLNIYKDCDKSGSLIGCLPSL